MKSKLLSFLILLMVCNTAFGQKQNTIAKFIVSDARINNVDVTQNYTAYSSYFVFYREANSKQTSFGSVMSKANSQSYGSIYEIHTKDIPETTDEYERQIYSFKWSFYNTYDKNKGTASVKLIKTFKPAGVAFELTIIPDNLDVCVYKGYMEGSLKDIE